MFKRMLFLFVTAAVMLSACSTLDIRLDQTPTPDSGQTPVAAATLTVKPAQTATKPSATEAPTTDPSLPAFTNLKFYWGPENHGECGTTYRVIFPAYIRRVYAQWDYVNMKAGILIRREWYHDGELWSQAEELWDFAKYGANGTVNDSYIYDFDAGLKPGNYELRVFISSNPQFGPEADKHSFTVDKDWSLEIASPNSLTTAVIAEPDKLKLRSADGTTWEVAKAEQISSLAWFPDSQHIVYVDTHQPETISGCNPYSIYHLMWIVDTATGEKRQISTAGESLITPVISPDGKYIAATSVNSVRNECMVGQKFALIELNNSFQQVGGIINMDKFSGVPASVDNWSITPGIHGVWKDATHFETSLTWVCPSRNYNASGMYSLDMESKHASRIGDLPTP